MRDTIVPSVKRKDNLLSDVKTLRTRARKHVEQGAVTEAYKADREKVLTQLERMASSIDWRVRRLESGETDPPS